MKILKPGFDIEKPLKQKINIEIPTANGLLDLELEPLPIGFYENLEKVLPTPNPPKTGWVRDRKGRFARDDLGKLIADYDEEDPKYLEDKRTAERRQNTAQLYAVLSTSKDIEFDAKAETFSGNGGSESFYDAIYQELVESGMNFGQQLNIIRAINKASGLSDDEIEDYKKN